MRDALKRWPWCAAVLFAYPMLHVAVTNPGQVEAGDVLPVVAAGLAAACALVALLRPVMGTWTAAGIGAAWVALLYYLYAPVNEWWIDWVRSGLEQQAARSTWYNAHPQLAQSAAWALIALAGLAGLRLAAKRMPDSVTGALNLVAALLVAFIAVQAISHAGTGRTRPAETAASSAPRPTGAASGPDIYFIVLDGYARADILADYYGFDNAPFLDGLRSRGFQVSDASRSNYYWTFLSVGSALNLDYIQGLVSGPLEPGSIDRTELYRLLRDNRASHFLRERGYRYVALQSTWGGTASNPYADTFLPCQAGLFGSEYLRAVVDMSWLRALSSEATMDIASCHLQNFETLAAQANSPGPKFVFAHFLLPHHPYLFDRDGNVLRHATISDQFEFQKRLWEDRKSYVDQLAYVNRRVGEVVDRLIANSPRPPVILLMSDHGPNLQRGMRSRDQFRVRLANLTAMYLPGAPAGFLPADETPVNHLRRIFNFCFDAEMPILPNRYFVSSFMQPYQFQEVSADNEMLPGQPGI